MAITGTKAFTSGEILTANDVNQYLMRGVKVFSSTAVRDAAYGGAGEPTLEEGETCYITATDELQSYDGSSWVKIGPTLNVGMQSIIPTSVTVTGGGSSGSVGANGEVTFGSAATVSINGCFSSAYRNYCAVMDFDATTGVNLQSRLRVAGSDNSTSNAYIMQRLTAAGTNTVGSLRQTSTEWIHGSASATRTNALWLQWVRPFLADETGISFVSLDSLDSAYYTTGVGTHTQATSYDGFTIYPNSGSITGTITIYGLFG